MSVRESIGTTLKVTTGLPNTMNSAGFNALSPSPVLVGQITEIPEHGAQSAKVEHTPLATGIVQKFHGAIDQGSLTVPLAFDASDPGQIILNAAFASRAQLSFIVETPDGRKVGRLGKVLSEVRVSMSSGSVISGNVMIEFDTVHVEITSVTPSNLVIPAISGIAQEGQTLTGFDGAWANMPSSFTRVWQEYITDTWTNIAGATGQTLLVPGGSTIGRALRYGVSATNGAGTSSIVYSAATAAVIAA